MDQLEAELIAERQMANAADSGVSSRRGGSPSAARAGGATTLAAAREDLRKAEQVADLQRGRVEELVGRVQALERRLDIAEQDRSAAQARLTSSLQDRDDERRRAAERLDAQRQDVRDAERRAEDAEARVAGARHSLEVERRARAAAEESASMAIKGGHQVKELEEALARSRLAVAEAEASTAAAAKDASDFAHELQALRASIAVDTESRQIKAKAESEELEKMKLALEAAKQVEVEMRRSCLASKQQ